MVWPWPLPLELVRACSVFRQCHARDHSQSLPRPNMFNGMSRGVPSRGQSFYSSCSSSDRDCDKHVADHSLPWVIEVVSLIAPWESNPAAPAPPHKRRMVLKKANHKIIAKISHARIPYTQRLLISLSLRYALNRPLNSEAKGFPPALNVCDSFHLTLCS